MEAIGRNLPAMSMVFAADLLATQSMIAIETTAVFPD